MLTCLCVLSSLLLCLLTLLCLFAAETLIEHGPGGGDPAVLVGTDQNGNKYFEKKRAQWGEPTLAAQRSSFRTLV